MDNRSSSQRQDSAAEKSSGCCGGKADAQPQANAEPRAAEPERDKPAKSGCCCGQN